MARPPIKTPAKASAKTPDMQQLDRSLRSAAPEVGGQTRAMPPSPAAPDRPSLMTLLRLSGWGFGMALALGLAMAVARTDRGMERLGQVFAGLNAKPAPQVTAQQVAARTAPDPLIETRRLAAQVAAQVEGLKADRERLVSRVAALERNLDDVTGSVQRTVARIDADRAIAEAAGGDNRDDPATTAATAKAPRTALRELTPLPRPVPSPPEVAQVQPAEPRAEPAETAEPAAEPAAPVASAAHTGSAGGAPPVPLVMHPTVIAATTVGVPDSLNPAAQGTRVGHDAQNTPHIVGSLARPEPASPAHKPPARLAYGIDLGGASTIDALRALWASTKAGHAPLLDRLEPAVVLRPTGKGGAPQLRLMAGPLADAAAAAALCKSFATGRGTCRPFAFDGHMLPLH